MSNSAYADHIAVLMTRSAEALVRAGRDHLLIASGVQKYQFLDDRPYVFAINPHFKHWLPLTEHTNCWLAITPGSKPVLVYYQPDDYWHLPPAAPSGYWVEHFDIRIVTDPTQIAANLPAASRSVILGEADAATGDYIPDNSAPALDYLHYHRAFKTAYEIEQMRIASRRAVRGHRAAEAAFHDGQSELGIHRAYLAATEHSDLDLPYGSIVGLNAHAAVLHYQYQNPVTPAESRSFLIDAGATHAGYAADITRTYAKSAGPFADLINSMDALQRELVNRVRVGQDYAALHLDCHRLLAGVLREHDIVRMDADEMLTCGVTSVFFPHGLGHLLGLQVHDVAGFQRDDRGGRIEKPEGHSALRLTRTLAESMVVTIEPGLYFIDTLLNGLRNGAHASKVSWSLIDELRPFGGIRIEDDVVCTADTPENLSRDAFAI